ncbi:MAG: hypothetical protein ACRCT2_11855, partial [Plesiomonas shigelloides]
APQIDDLMARKSDIRPPAGWSDHATAAPANEPVASAPVTDSVVSSAAQPAAPEQAPSAQPVADTAEQASDNAEKKDANPSDNKPAQ